MASSWTSLRHLITSLETIYCEGRSLSLHAAAASPRMDGVIFRLECTLCSLSLLFLALDVFIIARTKLHGPDEAFKGQNRWVCWSSTTQLSSGPHPHPSLSRLARLACSSSPLTPISGIYHDFVEHNLLCLLLHWISLLCYPVYLAFKT